MPAFGAPKSITLWTVLRKTGLGNEAASSMQIVLSKCIRLLSCLNF